MYYFNHGRWNSRLSQIVWPVQRGWPKTNSMSWALMLWKCGLWADRLQDMIAAIEMCQQNQTCYYNGDLVQQRDLILPRQPLCRYYGVRPTFSETTKGTHQNDIRKIWKNLYKAHEDQCLPSDTGLLHEQHGHCAGHVVEDDKGIVVSGAGTLQMKAIFEQDVAWVVEKEGEISHPPFSTITWPLVRGETFIADQLNRFGWHADFIKLACYPR